LDKKFCTEKSRFSEAIKIKLACMRQDLKTISPSLERNKGRERSSKLKQFNIIFCVLTEDP